MRAGKLQLKQAQLPFALAFHLSPPTTHQPTPLNVATHSCLPTHLPVRLEVSLHHVRLGHEEQLAQRRPAEHLLHRNRHLGQRFVVPAYKGGWVGKGWGYTSCKIVGCG